MISYKDSLTNELHSDINTLRNELSELRKEYDEFKKVNQRELEKIHEAKKTSERLLQMISANTSDMFIVHNPDYSINYVSDSIVELIGYTPEEYKSLDQMEIIHPDDKNMISERINKLLTDNEILIAEYRLFHKNGDLIWVETRSKKVRNKQGEIISIISSTNNITERRNILQKLSESEEIYRTLFDNIGEGFAFTDINDVFLHANPAAERIFGVTDSGLQARSLSEFLSDETKNLVDYQNELRKKGITSSYILPIIRHNGSKISIIATITPKFNSFGKYEGAYGIFRDITEFVKQEDSLKKSEKRLKLLNNFISEMLSLETLESFYEYTTTKLHEIYSDSIILFVSIDEEEKNTTLETIMGLKCNLMNKVISVSGFNPIGKSYSLLPKHHKIFKSGVFTEFSGGLAEFSDSEFPAIAANSLQKIFSIKKIYSIGVNKEDKLLGVVHFFTKKDEIKDKDFIELFIHQVAIVMERKLIEQSLHEKTLELIDANATKDKFFSIIAHDLRSPLSGIMRLTEVVSADMINMTITELEETIITLHKSSSNLFKLLDNLLQWSRINRSMIDFKPLSINMYEMIEEALSVLRFKSDEKQINIVNNVEDNIIVRVDQSMMLTVLRNLFSNAIKFSEKGDLIEIHASNINKDLIEVTIKDYGVGIEPLALPNIFQLDKVTSTIGTDGEMGSGLGLILCKEFIDKHGGEIIIDSTKGVGTEVRFSLPIG